jgi:D-xylose transport system permease protein
MNALIKSLKQSAIDWRLVLMGGVLVFVALVFNLLSAGVFLSPSRATLICRSAR